MIRRKVHITMIRWFVSSNTILKLFGLSRFVITKARQSISARSCWFVCVSRSELFAVWSKPGVVYFYYTLWHTNWPNVFLWRINYWLSDRRTWKICFDRLMFGGWCRLEKSSGLFFSFNKIRHFESRIRFLFLLFSSSCSWSANEEFLLPYRQTPNEIRAMLKHGNWLLILLNNKFRRKTFIKKLLTFNANQKCWSSTINECQMLLSWAFYVEALVMHLVPFSGTTLNVWILWTWKRNFAEVLLADNIAWDWLRYHQIENIQIDWTK